MRKAFAGVFALLLAAAATPAFAQAPQPVEKPSTTAKVPNFLDEFRSLCGEKLKANFHRRDKGRRHFREPHRFFTVAYIQCQNDAIAGG